MYPFSGSKRTSATKNLDEALVLNREALSFRLLPGRPLRSSSLKNLAVRLHLVHEKGPGEVIRLTGDAVYRVPFFHRDEDAGEPSD